MATSFRRYYKDKVEIDGQLYEVSPEVATCINRSNWNEDYQERKRRSPIKGKDTDGGTRDFDPLASSRECSLEAMLGSGAEHCFNAGTENESFEEAVVDRLTADVRTEILLDLIPGLSDEEKRMLTTITDGISSRQYEKMYGTPRRTMQARRARLLWDLRQRIEAEEKRGNSLRYVRRGRADVRALLG